MQKEFLRTLKTIHRSSGQESEEELLGLQVCFRG